MTKRMIALQGRYDFLDGLIQALQLLAYPSQTNAPSGSVYVRTNAALSW